MSMSSDDNVNGLDEFNKQCNRRAAVLFLIAAACFGLLFSFSVVDITNVDALTDDEAACIVHIGDKIEQADEEYETVAERLEVCQMFIDAFPNTKPWS